MARKLRPPGCGAAVVRDFVTYSGETYKRSNAAGRHVTRRRCPRCLESGAIGADDCDDGGDGGDGDGGGGSSSGAGSGGGLVGRGWLLDSTVDFGEAPGGFPWGMANEVHSVVAAKEAMRRADLVVVWGSELSILANYFDPW